MNKEKELYLVNIYTQYHTPKYMYDRRTLNLLFETKENERLILKLSKDDLIELKRSNGECRIMSRDKRWCRVCQ